MRIATWNVNSLTVRLPHLTQWLQSAQPDLLGLQEIKLTDDKFPHEPLQQLGYHCIAHGQKTYNGVAILSKLAEAPQDIQTRLPGMAEDPQSRLLAATYGEVRLINVYIPNGAEVGSDKFNYKLQWLSAFTAYIKEALRTYPKLVVIGDFNIAPDDRDVHDPKAWEGSVLVSPQERVYFSQLLELGLTDSFRLFEQPVESYSWWDYRAAAFVRNHGLRIDHILISPALTEKCQSCTIDIAPRKLERPSDHTPVIVDIHE